MDGGEGKGDGGDEAVQFKPSEQGLVLLQRVHSGVLAAIAELHALSVVAACKWYLLDPDVPIPKGHMAKSVARAVTLALGEATVNALARVEDVDRKGILSSLCTAAKRPDEIDCVMRIAMRMLSEYAGIQSTRFQIEQVIDDLLVEIEKAKAERRPLRLDLAKVRIEALKGKLK